MLMKSTKNGIPAKTLLEVPGPLGPGTPNQGLWDPLKDWAHRVGLQTQQRFHNNHSRLLWILVVSQTPK